ncbi:MAG: AAA family ATPase [Patescibacteria group bacterium]|nr:AAA family ATPase [Patescibacteria group bacterium]
MRETTRAEHKLASARTYGVPLIICRTPDQQDFARRVGALLAEDKTPSPVIGWDCIRGFSAINQAGTAVAGAAPANCTNLTEALEAAAKLPQRTCLLVYNGHFGVDETNVQRFSVIQALSNLRDLYTRDTRTAVILCPDLTVPAELTHDVYTIDDPLPTEDECEGIMRRLIGAHAKRKQREAVIDEENLRHAVDAVAGLAAFTVEQAAAMSFKFSTDLGRYDIDVAQLWERKRSFVAGTAGLSIYRGKETFADVGGYENLKTFLGRLNKSKRAPRAYVFLDEIEKQVAGATGAVQDSSGTAQEQLALVLSHMQDTRATGLLLIGPGGTGKSLVCKAAGNEAAVPTIVLDLSATKASLVGESGARMRLALKVIDSVARGHAVWVATCNRIGSLPPELRRRFKAGTYFMDLPTKAERETIWRYYLDRHGIPAQPRPDDEGWTGAEIEECCAKADQLGMSLTEAALYICPVAKAAEAEIRQLRAEAHERFLSASYPGFYKMAAAETALSTARLIEDASEED